MEVKPFSTRYGSSGTLAQGLGCQMLDREQSGQVEVKPFSTRYGSSGTLGPRLGLPDA